MTYERMVYFWAGFGPDISSGSVFLVCVIGTIAVARFVNNLVYSYVPVGLTIFMVSAGFFSFFVLFFVLFPLWIIVSAKSSTESWTDKFEVSTFGALFLVFLRFCQVGNGV